MDCKLGNIESFKKMRFFNFVSSKFLTWKSSSWFLSVSGWSNHESRHWKDGWGSCENNDDDVIGESDNKFHHVWAESILGAFSLVNLSNFSYCFNLFISYEFKIRFNLAWKPINFDKQSTSVQFQYWDSRFILKYRSFNTSQTLLIGIP